jgi:hypothetical protein
LDVRNGIEVIDPHESSNLHRFERAIAAIDAVNARDPNRIRVRGKEGPKELLHAELVSEWILRLRPSASEALRLAARAHHVERWAIERSEYPDDREGYLRWRKSLQEHHAEVAARLLGELGYEREAVARVQSVIRKRGLRRDPEVQAFEDALCLVFLETQFRDLAGRLTADRMIDVLRKTLHLMSEAGCREALAMELGSEERRLLERALESPSA